MIWSPRTEATSTSQEEGNSATQVLLTKYEIRNRGAAKANGQRVSLSFFENVLCARGLAVLVLYRAIHANPAC